MTATSHAAAGATIALIVKEPLIALPLALISHFVMDALPHFGYPGHGGFGEALKHRLTYIFISIDIVAFIFFVTLITELPWVVIFAALVAIVPDIIWATYYFGYERRGLTPPGKNFLNFHSRLQWCERPWGIWIEVGAIALLLYLVIILR